MRWNAGFSLVELIIVIAIAAFIFVVVFYSFEQANNGRRDDARKTDAGRFLAAAKLWETDHNGILPGNENCSNCYNQPDPVHTQVKNQGYADAQDIINKYITAGGASFIAPGTNTPWGPDFIDGFTTPDKITIYLGAPATCVNGQITAVSGGRQIAVLVYQDTGGTYCISQ